MYIITYIQIFMVRLGMVCPCFTNIPDDSWCNNLQSFDPWVQAWMRARLRRVRYHLWSAEFSGSAKGWKVRFFNYLMSLKKSGRYWRYGILENVHWSSWSWRMALANNMAQCFGTHLWEWLVDRLFSSRSCCPDGPWTVFMYRSFGLVLCCISF